MPTPKLASRRSSPFRLYHFFLGGILGLAVALALIGVAYLGRIVRSVMLALRTRTPLFYIIFYLCALDFLPLAVLARLALAH